MTKVRLIVVQTKIVLSQVMWHTTGPKITEREREQGNQRGHVGVYGKQSSTQFTLRGSKHIKLAQRVCVESNLLEMEHVSQIHFLIVTYL